MEEQFGVRPGVAVWRPGSPFGRRPVLRWPAGVEAAARSCAHRVRSWALAEVAPGRLVPWLAIAFGVGTVLYFAADQEPSSWAAAGALAGACSVAFVARRHAVLFPLAVAVAAVAGGFAAGAIERAWVAHPVLQVATSNVTIEGFVETREERERSDRIVVRVNRIEGGRLDEEHPLERVRISIGKGGAPAARAAPPAGGAAAAFRPSIAPPVGSFVRFKARLSPPLEPLRPGGYDFARDMYFQQIGASGFPLGKIEVAAPAAERGLWLRYAAVLDGIRKTIDQRIRAVLPGDEGSIASALITGMNDPISTPVSTAMIISSLVHVLSISGYHMAVIAGIVFFTVRALLALVPGFANRHPIKKWAALAALIVTALYLLLSGSAVATQRILHHDRHRSDRRVGRPAGAHLPHSDGGGAGGAAAGAGGCRQSELPDVVCRDAGAHRRIPARPAVAARRPGHSARRAHRALGRTRDRGSYLRVTPGRRRDHAVHRLPFPSVHAVRTARQSSGDARGVGGGDAGRHPRRAGHAVRLR